MTDSVGLVLKDIMNYHPFFTGFVVGELGWTTAEWINRNTQLPFSTRAGVVGGLLAYLLNSLAWAMRRDVTVWTYLLAYVSGYWANTKYYCSGMEVLDLNKKAT